ncbi:Bug family tripartite tricarboxylate transporter substrate binding protein [Verticiella sediminum]|nr:tripartite tricarboxylate transporter substrate binding protein [Verticiella sediminum]
MHKLSRRGFLGTAAVLGAALPLTAVRADPYPSRPIRLITPNSAGSSVDKLARRVGDHLNRGLGTAVVVENIPGAGGIIGTERLISSPPDGYTLALVAKNHIIIPLVNTAVRYDALKQVTPVCTVLESCGVLAARPGFPAKTAADLIAYARQYPGKVNFGSSGVGTSVDLQGRVLQQIGGIDVVNVAYRGVSALVPDLMSGVVDVAFFGLSAVSEQIHAGSLTGLGITRPQRLAAFPDIPPIAESVPGYSFSGWYALIAPAGLDASIAQRLSDEIARLQADPSFVEMAAREGEAPMSMTGVQLAEFMAQESRDIAALVKSADIRIS